MAQQLFRKVGQQMLTKIGQQMLTKIGQQMLTKIDRQLFHTIATDGRLAGAKQQMFLTYTIENVTPDRFFCLLQDRPLYHYLSLTYNTLHSSQPFYLHQLFTIQPLRSTGSSAALTLLCPFVTYSLKFANLFCLSGKNSHQSDLILQTHQHLTLAIYVQVFHSNWKPLLLD